MTTKTTAAVQSAFFAALLLLAGPLAAQDAKPAAKATEAPDIQEERVYVDKDAGSLHNQLFIESRYPSAHTCGQCHPQQFREWSVSPHAYATFSPVFQAFNGTLLKRTGGSLGDFCIRCHAATAINLGEPVFLPTTQRNPLGREGVNCIICHRNQDANGKISGRQRLTPASIFEAVDGPTGNVELKRVIESGEFPIRTDNKTRGQSIHADVRKFDQMTTNAFCGTCHDVTIPNGFRFEDLFSDFKGGPAAKEGTRCHDCHMGRRPGVSDSGFYRGPAAVINGKPTKERKVTDHMFIGPDYPIVHPGVFPHNAAAKEFASIMEWFAFDWRAGWGTEEFEDEVSDDYAFPERWEDVSDREEAREILADQLALLKEANTARLELMQAALGPGRWEVSQADDGGLAFRIEVKNKMKGHSVPSGFDGERLIFLRVFVRDAAGEIVYKSGDLDPNGDLRDSHSSYVHNGELPADSDLFSLQTTTVTRALRGGETDSILPVPVSVTALPFIRPQVASSVLKARFRGSRKQKNSIPPLDSRWGSYSVGAEALAGTKGPYTANVQLIFGEFPVNLINEVKEAGFDYNMTPRQLAEEVVRGHMTIFERELPIKPGDGKFDPSTTARYKRTVIDGFSSN
jgi:nitrate/TMAO reductase-like tetraheme cytochrome c subunit